MSFDRNALQRAIAAHGRVARVVVAEVRGSTPREVGASMLVWPSAKSGGQLGTIGGGALEYEAARHAFDRQGATRHPLGPSLGQCCGGSVTLWTEVWDAKALDAQKGQVVARGPGQRPLAVARMLDRARGRGILPQPGLVQGWMVEPVVAQRQPLWIWGAGHVGRALVQVLSPLAFDITWVDTGPERFPSEVPDNITILPAARPENAMALAPAEAAHLIVTYSHDLDLQLCHAALLRGFGFCGLIGSDTKWVRFRKRLSELGHGEAQIDSICCPIGQKSLGKAPQAIAIGVAAQLLTMQMGEQGAWQTHSCRSTG